MFGIHFATILGKSQNRNRRFLLNLLIEASICGGGFLRRVTSTDERWLRPGVGSTDAAALVGCAADRDDNALTLWARIRSKMETTALKKVKLAQGSGQWLDWRKAGVGGSEVACVVGANPYSGSKALDVWARKLPADHPKAKPEVSDNPNMAWGRKYEPDARRIYQELFGWTAEDVCVLHDDHECVRCSLDGLRPDNKVVLEIKCPGEKNHEKYIAISRIEDHFERQTEYAKVFPYYRYQIAYQLEITQADYCHFVSYRPTWPEPSERFVQMTLYPEPEEQKRLLERVLEFWIYVETRTAPPAEWLVPCHRLPESLKIPE